MGNFNFWDSEVWGTFSLFAVVLISLLAANALKRTIGFLKRSLIPTSVLGGGILVLVEAIYRWITGDAMFDTAFFGGNGTATLELVTNYMSDPTYYAGLALQRAKELL